jgi:aspartyl-tRNA(Asn)/glutamyl-tRNA(Gln) amidotransferase subunit A
MSHEKNLNAYITETPGRARAQAERSDELLRSKRARALEGVVIAVKDNYCTTDIRTTAGSKILGNFVPTYESFVTRRLLEAGAVFVGKTNMDEFGMGSSTENSAYGPTINPRGVLRGLHNIAPGGSSGGSAAAVAANLCLGSVATDTGGSIRQPASFCGVVGFKPTYGVCSRWGIIAYASSLDQAGVITKSVHDAAILMDVISGGDFNDTTSIDGLKISFEKNLAAVGPGFTVGIPRSFYEMQVNRELESLWARMHELVLKAGGSVKYIEMPSIKYALPAYYIIALSEASSNLARYDGVRFGYRSKHQDSIDEMYEWTRAEGFGWETRKRIIAGTFCLSSGYYDAYYLRAQKARRRINEEFLAAFRDVDFLIWPTAPTPPFEFGSHAHDPISIYLEDVFTVPINLAGLPAISIPVHLSSQGLPMGMQVIGRPLGDASVLSVAHRLMGFM